MSYFEQVTGEENILRVIRSYLLASKNQPSSFIPAIHRRKGCEWNGQVMPGGHIIEGGRILSLSTDHSKIPEEIRISISLDRHDCLAGSTLLSDITHLEIFRK